MSDDERHRVLCAEHSVLVGRMYDRTPPSLTADEEARLAVVRAEIDDIECALTAPDFERLEALVTQAQALADEIRGALAEIRKLRRR